MSNPLRLVTKLPLHHYKVGWLSNYDSQSNSFEKPWFMMNGTIKASNNYSYELILWPEEIINKGRLSMDDRIVNQLMYIPRDYNKNNFVPKGKLPLKKILLAYGKHGWNDLVLGRKKFLQDNCPVNACFIMANTDLIEKADAVIFKDRFVWPKKGRPSYQQLWILFLLESPFNTQLFTSLPSNVFNWTATYRYDSDIVAPYEKFVSYDSIFNNDFHIPDMKGLRNYAKGKKKKVAWFVSNCGAKNKRLEYARELSKFIEVDIYGSCGKMKCPRSKAKECFEMLNKDYKFYLAFENSNCRDYITEKFFVNGLGHNFYDLNVVPIVMGAHPNDYQRAAPQNSYIHIDDFESPAHLASYLHKLDQDDESYNRFFEWKSNPIRRRGEFINTYFWCRLCALLHATEDRRKIMSYQNIAQWWAPKNICLDSSYKWPPEQKSNSY